MKRLTNKHLAEIALQKVEDIMRKEKIAISFRGTNTIISHKDEDYFAREYYDQITFFPRLCEEEKLYIIE